MSEFNDAFGSISTIEDVCNEFLINPREALTFLEDTFENLGINLSTRQAILDCLERAGTIQSADSFSSLPTITQGTEDSSALEKVEKLKKQC